MKWINHKLTTFSITLLLLKDLLLSIAIAVASVIPDSIEGKDYENPRWKQRHRKLSHWPVIYLAITVAGITMLMINKITLWKTKSFNVIISSLGNQASTEILIGYGLFAIGLGGLLHIFEDSISAKVPLLHPTKRVFGWYLIRTGSFPEYLFSILLFISAVYFAWLK